MRRFMLFGYRLLSILSVICLSVMILTGCSEEEPETTIEDGRQQKTTILIYAVASNNLANDLRNDMMEIYDAADKIKGLNESVTVLLYNVFPGNDYARLSRLVKNDGVYTFEKVRGYDRKTYSTDPKRIREVIDDAYSIAPADYNGIIFWSHGTGWTPDFSGHAYESRATSLPSSLTPGETIKSFGSDSYMYKTDSCDINELVDAIPSDRFNFIWFDCCYMNGIELMYQLRGKCDTLIAYPTEIMSEGMPYHLTLPYIASEKPDFEAAANTLFDYYNNKKQPVTVMISDLSVEKLDHLAEISANILKDAVELKQYELYRYSRQLNGPFFDLKQYLTNSLNPLRGDKESLLKELNDVLDDIVILKKLSEKDFRGADIPQDEVTAISCHIPGAQTAEHEEYYKTLEWYKRVYASNEE